MPITSVRMVNVPETQVSPKKSKAPSVGAAIGAGIGATKLITRRSFIGNIAKVMNDLFIIRSHMNPKRARAIANVTVGFGAVIAFGFFALGGLLVGKIVSAFTKSARKKAAIEEAGKIP